MGIDLAQAWDQVVAQIAAQFPDFNVQAGEDADRETLTLPAILIDLTELEPTPEADPSTGEWPCLVHFEARVIFQFRTVQVRREVSRAAGALAAFAHNSRMGLPWGAGVVIACTPDDFAPRAEQADLWLVEWVHQADLGDRFESEDGITPTEVFFSHAPDIGADHEADYEEVTDGE